MKRSLVFVSLVTPLLTQLACGARQTEAASPEPMAAASPPGAADNAESRSSGASSASGAELMLASEEGAKQAADPPGPQQAPVPAPPEARTPDDASAPSSPGAVDKAPMLDIEARLGIEVSDMRDAVERLHQQLQKSHGQLVEETFNNEDHQAPTANITLRIPAQGAQDFLKELESLGAIRTRQVSSRDVGKDYFDAQLRLQNLQRVIARLEEILALAKTVEETMKVETEIGRVRGEIEQLKGEIRWLKDRSSRATIHLELFAKRHWVDTGVSPEAKFYPGLRMTTMLDLRGAQGSQSTYGGGFSLRFSRHFSLDVDGLQSRLFGKGDLDRLMITAGGDLYSDYLGGGSRRWFNPYIGFRGGYSRVAGYNELVAGGALGFELYKSPVLLVDTEVRLYGAFGNHYGAHALVQPALGINVAF